MPVILDSFLSNTFKGLGNWRGRALVPGYESMLFASASKWTIGTFATLKCLHSLTLAGCIPSFPVQDPRWYSWKCYCCLTYLPESVGLFHSSAWMDSIPFFCRKALVQWFDKALRGIRMPGIMLLFDLPESTHYEQSCATHTSRPLCHLQWVIQTVFQLILTLKIVTTAPATGSSLTSIFCHMKH